MWIQTCTGPAETKHLRRFNGTVMPRTSGDRQGVEGRVSEARRAVLWNPPRSHGLHNWHRDINGQTCEKNANRAHISARPATSSCRARNCVWHRKCNVRSGTMLEFHHADAAAQRSFKDLAASVTAHRDSLTQVISHVDC